jgi:Protein of unknown function (DUF2798)
MNATPAGQAGPSGHRIDPKYVPYLVPAIMAIAMSFTMSFVQTIVRIGFRSNLPSAWLTSFTIGVAVAIPTAIFIAPSCPATGWPSHRHAARLTACCPRTS